MGTPLAATVAAYAYRGRHATPGASREIAPCDTPATVGQWLETMGAIAYTITPHGDDPYLKAETLAIAVQAYTHAQWVVRRD